MHLNLGNSSSQAWLHHWGMRAPFSPAGLGSGYLASWEIQQLASCDTSERTATAMVPLPLVGKPHPMPWHRHPSASTSWHRGILVPIP